VRREYQVLIVERFTALLREAPAKSAAWQRIGILLAAIAVEVMLSAVIPPFQSPDEFDHIKRSAALLSGQVRVTTPRGGNSGLWVDDGLLSYMKVYERLPFRPGARVNVAMIQESELLLWAGSKSFSSAPGVGYYFPLAYLPQAMGLLAGETLGWTIASSYRLARLMVLVSSAAILFMAFTLFPTNFFTLSLLVLPTTLFQMSSASLDAVTTALAILCASLFMRGANRHATFPPWMAVTMGGAVGILTTCRLNMVALILMPLFIYFVRRERLYLLLSIGLVVLSGAWTVVALSTTHAVKNGMEQPVLSITLHYLSHPWQFTKVLWATFSTGTIDEMYMRQFIGTLGWLDTGLPVWFYVMEVATLISALLLSISGGTLKDDVLQRWMLVVASLAGIVLLLALLLVTWTQHPATIVMGIQGRYFLLPVLIFSYALHGNTKLLQTKRVYIAYPLLAISCLTTIYVMTNSLLQRYYVSPAIWLK
jgi:uncharacterized membrane protein